MTIRDEKVEAFRALHASGCFVIPNPWDLGGALAMQALGFKALATTSSGYAWSIGREDNAREVSREQTLDYAGALASAAIIPVSADMEDCYSESLEGVAETVRLAAEAGLAGLSIEDRDPSGATGFRDFDSAVARVGAAAEAARRHNIVLTARADGIGKGAYGLDEAIRRLQAFEALGAEVLYAPAIPSLEGLERLCSAVSSPVNHLVGQGVSGLSFAQIAGAGVRRISLGGTLARSLAGDLLDTCRGIASGDFSRIEQAPSWGEIRRPASP